MIFPVTGLNTYTQSFDRFITCFELCLFYKDVYIMRWKCDGHVVKELNIGGF
jgi:hypothetical protein